MSGCDGCTACCHSLCLDESDGVDYKFGGSCENVCESGCGIYDSRPEACLYFECAYLQYGLPRLHLPETRGFFVETLDPHCVEIHPIYHGQRNVQPDAWMSEHRENILETLDEVELHSGSFIRNVQVNTLNGRRDFNRFVIASTTL